MALQPGSVFAGYVIERLLGSGGMGEVYVARHPRLPRSDALKVLSAELSGDPMFRRRFEQEADVVAGLRHRGIVTVHDRGESAGRLWIALELVEGTDARAAAWRAGMSVQDVGAVIGPVAEALDYAGARGLVHRDVKPANILIARDRRVVLTDFGIVSQREADARLTGTGLMIGTVHYMSPAQAQGARVDTRSDQYSLAATAFDLLCGAPPFASSNVGAVIVGHATRPVPSVRAVRPDLHPDVDRVLGRALAKAPEDRYPSSVAFASDLVAALSRTVAAPTVRSPYAAPYVPSYGPDGAGAAARDGGPLPRTAVETRPGPSPELHGGPYADGGAVVLAPPGFAHLPGPLPPLGPGGPVDKGRTRRRWAFFLALATVVLYLAAGLTTLAAGKGSGIGTAAEVFSTLAAVGYFAATILNIRFGGWGRPVAVGVLWAVTFLLPLTLVAVTIGVGADIRATLAVVVVFAAVNPAVLSAIWVVGSARTKVLVALPFAVLVGTLALFGAVVATTGDGGALAGVETVIVLATPIAILLTVLITRIVEAREARSRVPVPSGPVGW